MGHNDRTKEELFAEVQSLRAELAALKQNNDFCEVKDSPVESQNLDRLKYAKEVFLHWVAAKNKVSPHETNQEAQLFNALINITEHKQAEERQKVRERQQLGLAQLGQQALEGLDFLTLMNQALALVAHNLEVEYSQILELLPDRKTFIVRAGVGWRDNFIGHTIASTPSNGHVGYTLQQGKPVVIENLRTEKRFSIPRLLEEYQVVSGVSVIFQKNDRPFGILAAYTKKRRMFNKDDIQFLQAMADVLGTAIERYETEEALQKTNDELEAKVAERTLELSRVNEQLHKELQERKQAEEALLQSEERFRSAFDNAATGMAMVTPDGHWLKVNHSLCEIIGYSESELLTITVPDLTPPQEWDRDLKHIHKMLDGEIRYYQTEKRYRHKLGHSVWVLESVSCIDNSQGEVLYLVSQIQDITERRRLEQMKNEFISVVSHELRTPLTSIRGSLGLLASGRLNNQPETAKRLLEIAAIDTERLVRLVNDILTLERLESGKVVLVKENCNAAALMLRSIESMQPIAKESEVTLCFSPLDTEVCVDADSIIQILMNLLSNAIKFSSGDSIVTLEAENKGDWILFRVKDRGRGIPSDKLETIFGKFQQVDASDSRQKGGTGLGLPICRNIVEQHGGKIWAESVLGEGSSFCFTLPLSLKPTSSTPEL